MQLQLVASTEALEKRIEARALLGDPPREELQVKGTNLQCAEDARTLNVNQLCLGAMVFAAMSAIRLL